jgi:thioredoxin reductase
MINYYEFVVIGAGVAGITAISKLLDANISNIAWVDTDFTTTGMLADWRTVDANTTIDLIEDKFLMKSESFKYSEIKHKFGLQNLGGKETCKIGLVVDILLHISKELQKRVPCFEGFATWSKNVVTIGSRTLQTKRIILATGSKPKLPVDVPTNFLRVEDALNISRLATLVKKDAKVAVFGSSHSSLLIIRDLLSLGAHVLNFYRSEIIYAYESACGNNINWYTGNFSIYI